MKLQFEMRNSKNVYSENTVVLGLVFLFGHLMFVHSQYWPIGAYINIIVTFCEYSFLHFSARNFGGFSCEMDSSHSLQTATCTIHF